MPAARGCTGTNNNNHLLTNNKIIIIIEARSPVVHAGLSIYWVAKDDLDSLILLPSLPKCWDHRSPLSCPICPEPGLEPGTLCILEKHSATKLHP